MAYAKPCSWRCFRAARYWNSESEDVICWTYARVLVLAVLVSLRRSLWHAWIPSRPCPLVVLEIRLRVVGGCRLLQPSCRSKESSRLRVSVSTSSISPESPLPAPSSQHKPDEGHMVSIGWLLMCQSSREFNVGT